MDSRVSLLEETTEKIQQQNNEILALLRQQMTNNAQAAISNSTGQPQPGPVQKLGSSLEGPGGG
jgi:hypothetical protein